MKIIGRFENESRANALNSAVIVLLIALMGVSMPYEWMGAVMSKLAAAALVRYVFSAIGVLLMFLYGLHGGLKITKRTTAGLVAFLAAMLVAFCNFPYHSLASGRARYIADGSALTVFLLFCFSVGCFEEIFFRGLILPLLLKRFGKHKQGALIAILASSALFGLIHLINLFGGAGIGAVMLQIGYSTLIGAICACLVYFSGCVWFAVLFHAAFDVGGLMSDYGIIQGSIWSAPEIIAMALAGVAAGTYLLVKFIRVARKRRAEERPQISKN